MCYQNRTFALANNKCSRSGTKLDPFQPGRDLQIVFPSVTTDAARNETIRNFCRSVGAEQPPLHPVTLDRSHALVWFRGGGEPIVVAVEPGKSEHKRHIRKYADGDLGKGSFVFCGPESKLHLVAHNLNTFIRMASGVDDETWTWHLRAHDYSRWFRKFIKDDALAEEVEGIENEDHPPNEARDRLFAAIRGRYTAPA